MLRDVYEAGITARPSRLIVPLNPEDDDYDYDNDDDDDELRRERERERERALYPKGKSLEIVRQRETRFSLRVSTSDTNMSVVVSDVTG